MVRLGCRARYALLVAAAHAQTSVAPTGLPTAVPTATPSSAPTVSPQPTPMPVPVPTHVPSTSPTVSKAPTPAADEAAWCDFLGKKNCARRRTTPWLFYGAPALFLLCL